MKNIDYISKLNKDQFEAVTYLGGPLLIVAGAGSGKTRVLTSKIAHIIDQKKHFQTRYWQLLLQIRQLKKCNTESQNF